MMLDFPKYVLILSVVLLTVLLPARWVFTSDGKTTDPPVEIVKGGNGLHGYIGYQTPRRPEGYGAGIGFYTAVWPLVERPLAGFQIGLPGNWITPDNPDNKDIPCCPEGTIARTWEPRGPTWSSVFQTQEGGLGYWRGNRYHYGSPKFSMNGVPDCYNSEIASPGWPFFYRAEALPEDQLGIAQLSNSMLVPPDGITFEGDLQGKFLGYTHMALPLTEARPGPPATGDHSWTLFLNAENFKGPVAFYIPEMWSRLSKDYPIIEGMGLDAREGIMGGGGAMEINTVPSFEWQDANGDVYVKIPRLQFPLDESGRSVLVQDVTYYSKDALFNYLLEWKKSGKSYSGRFDETHAWKPELSPRAIRLDQRDAKENAQKDLTNLEGVFETIVTDSNAFGLAWSDNPYAEQGHFPQYFKQQGDKRIPIRLDEVPEALLKAEFPGAETEANYVNWRNGNEIVEGNFIIDKKAPYATPSTGGWVSPGPSSDAYTVLLKDGSTVTYKWYRFVDQPSFQRLGWSNEEKKQLQAFVENIHRHWGIDQEYMAPPTTGSLVAIDPALLVTPPKGMEYGYVPIVIRQENLLLSER
ncbi:hypothetical protein ADIS_1963 [Lunatimonas lonarensis]|uniref:Uncharacterized protein n=1 Tax=Lunatimonas lonarensis TaxID=1232681 RepID=R7ZTV9_9BACT|nr:hypothetical protein [Lunatimonas lonarensis]EON77560.1 hypothetical protein ADIS_1963 [Lunatimonas lonarensis]